MKTHEEMLNALKHAFTDRPQTRNVLWGKCGGPLGQDNITFNHCLVVLVACVRAVDTNGAGFRLPTAEERKEYEDAATDMEAEPEPEPEPEPKQIKRGGKPIKVKKPEAAMPTLKET